MLMQDIMNASDVRREWGKFIDDVVRDKPKVVKRNRDMLFAVSLEHLEQILQQYQFNLQIIKEENDSYVVTLSELDVVSSGKSLEDAVTTFAGDLIEYAQEYMDDFQIYYNAPNRKPHFPYVLRILNQDSIEGVKRLFNA